MFGWRERRRAATVEALVEIVQEMAPSEQQEDAVRELGRIDTARAVDRALELCRAGERDAGARILELVAAPRPSRCGRSRRR